MLPPEPEPEPSSMLLGQCDAGRASARLSAIPRPRPLLLVLVGRCGVGKSSTANTLLGYPVFRSRRSAASITQSCQLAQLLPLLPTQRRSGSGAIAKVEAEEREQEVYVLDTPGLGCADVAEAELHAEMRRGFAHAVASCGAGGREGDEAAGTLEAASSSTVASAANTAGWEGVDVALVLVLSIAAGRVSEDELRSFGRLGSVFGLRYYQHALVLFTHSDMLLAPPRQGEEDVESRRAGLEEYMAESGELAVQRFLADVKGGYLALSNAVQLQPDRHSAAAASVAAAAAAAGQLGQVAPPPPATAAAAAEVVQRARAVCGAANNLAPPRPRRKAERRRRQREQQQHAAAAASGSAHRRRHAPSGWGEWAGEWAGWLLGGTQMVPSADHQVGARSPPEDSDQPQYGKVL
jgi:hypothetical protein